MPSIIDQNTFQSGDGSAGGLGIQDQQSNQQPDVAPSTDMLAGNPIFQMFERMLPQFNFQANRQTSQVLNQARALVAWENQRKQRANNGM